MKKEEISRRLDAVVDAAGTFEIEADMPAESWPRFAMALFATGLSYAQSLVDGYAEGVGEDAVVVSCICAAADIAAAEPGGRFEGTVERV